MLLFTRVEVPVVSVCPLRVRVRVCSLLDRVADGMMFGALQPCAACGGALSVNEYGYSCHGFFSAWTRCSGDAGAVARLPWSLNDAVDKSVAPFKGYKGKARTRLFPERAAPPVAPVVAAPAYAPRSSLTAQPGVRVAPL